MKTKAKIMLLAGLMIFLFSQISFPFGHLGDWRWRNDDGDVYSATWKDSLNTPLVISSNYEDNIRLRVKFLYTDLYPGNISLQYSERPGDDPWVLINNVDTGKFFISQSSYLTDTMSYFDNELLPPDPDNPYLRTITLDSSYNYNFTGVYNHTYEMEYSLKIGPDIEPGKAYFFSLYCDQDSIFLGSEEYPILMTPPVNWEIQISGTTENLSGVSFIDENNGWIVGGNGTILHTTDGGNDWILQQNVTAEYLSDIFFIDGNNGWIVGENGTILHTTNGGDPWISESGGTTNYLTSVWFIDENNGWVVGYDGTILHTTDGGNNWYNQSVGTTWPLNDVTFKDENNGIVISGISAIDGQWGRFYKTTDGGETWSYSEVYVYLKAVSFADANNATVVGGDYIFNVGGETTAMYRTTDGGETWTPQDPITSRPILDVFFADADNGWAVGEGGVILRSTNGGATWDIQAIGTMMNLNAVSFADANNGLVVGGQGKIWRTSDGGNIPVELNSFTGVTNDNNVLLNWTTATEKNNSGFTIERSKDNQSFSRLGFVPGSGTTTQLHTYSYTDKDLKNGKYYYRLKQIDFEGSYEYSDALEVTVNVPLTFSLQQNFPNPFNPATTIKYSIPKNSYITLKIYDVLGGEVKTLIKEEKSAGTYELNWNAANLPSGVYFYQLKADEYTAVKKMILLK